LSYLRIATHTYAANYAEKEVIASCLYYHFLDWIFYCFALPLKGKV